MTAGAYHGVLIVAEMEGDHVHRVAYELLHQGRQIADAVQAPLTCLLLTGRTVDPAELCQRGADRVYLMEHAAFANVEEQFFTENIVAFIREHRPETVLIGATHLGRSLAPRVAAALNTGLTADCTDLRVDSEGNLEQIRPAFSDNILAHIKTIRRPQMATVRYKEFSEASFSAEAKIAIERIAPYTTEIRGVKIDQVIEIGGAHITDAEVIVAGGRGIRKAEDLQLLKTLADLLGGQVGVSRALVDAGMAASTMQVGYSGNRVKPKVYIACGISGAPQHLAGMKESALIVAINNDPSAPIFNIADYGYVGDLYAVVPKLIETLRKEAQSR